MSWTRSSALTRTWTSTSWRSSPISFICLFKLLFSEAHGPLSAIRILDVVQPANDAVGVPRHGDAWAELLRHGRPRCLNGPTAGESRGPSPVTQTDDPPGTYVSLHARPDERQAQFDLREATKCVRSIELERSGSRR
jgi:hypothetical protein